MALLLCALVAVPGASAEHGPRECIVGRVVLGGLYNNQGSIIIGEQEICGEFTAKYADDVPEGCPPALFTSEGLEVGLIRDLVVTLGDLNHLFEHRPRIRIPEVSSLVTPIIRNY